MATQSVKLDKNPMARVRKCIEAGGYSSPEEFVQHVLERELSRMETGDSDEEIGRKLKGLGYLE